jgi:arginine/lysine/ornithine decarboxylase
MHQVGKESIIKGLKVVKHVREQIKIKLPVIAVIEIEVTNLAYDTLDPFKITLSDRSGTWSGYQLRDKLGLAGSDAEMADATHVLLHFSLASDEIDANRLLSALSDIFLPLCMKKQDFLGEISNKNSVHLSSQISTPIPMMLPQKSDALKVNAVPLEAAPGFCSAEMVIPYPPGIPLLYIGERITEQIVAQIKWITNQGASFQGIKDTSLTLISVFSE